MSYQILQLLSISEISYINLCPFLKWSRHTLFMSKITFLRGFHSFIPVIMQEVKPGDLHFSFRLAEKTTRRTTRSTPRSGHSLYYAHYREHWRRQIGEAGPHLPESKTCFKRSQMKRVHVLCMTVNYFTSVCTCREKRSRSSHRTRIHSQREIGGKYNPFTKQYTFLLARGPLASLPVWGLEKPCQVRPHTCVLVLGEETTLLPKSLPISEEYEFVSWPAWLSCLGFVLQSKMSLVWLLVRACAWVVGSVPLRGACERKMIDVSLPLFLSPFHSLKNK